MFAALAMLGIATTALAHSTVKNTVPANEAVLPASPPAVVINFNEPARLVSVSVVHAGAPERKLTFAPEAEATSFTTAVPQLEPGRNEIKWRALSRDGHPISGTIVLTVQPATGAAKAP
ncbi:copper resistance CopC family protein [Peristeroidobacter soli]|jgi:methionine-rich copper-binding protein CopC|uniref:copper resistance CopC family protein n=1 Tax=Peristeroidobacter soli TaxID=2497877 RepID=UPI0013005AC8|nr:copper resistance CopC family protein [Peristeroidobacter soli]